MITNIIGAILGCSVDMVGILHPFNVLEFVLLRWFRCFNVQACTVVLPENWGGGEVLPPSIGRDTSHSFVIPEFHQQHCHLEIHQPTFLTAIIPLACRRRENNESNHKPARSM